MAGGEAVSDWSSQGGRRQEESGDEEVCGGQRALLPPAEPLSKTTDSWLNIRGFQVFFRRFFIFFPSCFNLQESKLEEKEQAMESWRKERDALVAALEVQLQKLLSSQAEKEKVIKELQSTQRPAEVSVAPQFPFLTLDR